MLITVKYRNGRTGRVHAYQLEELISANKIKQFLRSEGWVTIGVDPIRQNGQKNILSGRADSDKQTLR